jgi:Helicase HerA, central domain
MSDERECGVFVGTGHTGVGKSYAMCRIIRDYLTPNPQTGKVPRKVLIFDVNKEYTNEEMIKNGHGFTIKTIALSQLDEWVRYPFAEVCRILPVDKDGRNISQERYKEILNYILQRFKGGLLLLEDLNNYLKESNDAEILGLLTTVRHEGVDVYIHYQSLSRVTTGVWQNARGFRVHHQYDPVYRYFTRMNNPEMFVIAQKIVDKKYENGDIRYYLYVMSTISKIKGNFTKREFVNAALEYLDENPKEWKRKSLTFRGLKQDNEDAAKRLKVLELFKKFYGGSEQ